MYTLQCFHKPVRVRKNLWHLSNFKTFTCIVNDVLTIYRVIQNDCRGLVYSCADGSRNSQSFLLWYAVCSSYAFLPEQKVRIRTAIETITADMLQTVWNELDFRVDVCRITKGAHIEHL